MQVAFSAMFVSVTPQCCGNALRSSQTGIGFPNFVVNYMLSVLADDTGTLTSIIYYLRVSLAFVDFGSSSFFTD